MKTLSLTQDKFLNQILTILGGSWLIALGSLISIPLPFSPVPVSFCLFTIILLTIVLGKRGVAATLAYIAQGAAGLPVFSLGRSGIAHLMGPTGGYILGYVVVAACIAFLIRRMERRTPLAMISLLFFGFALVYGFGVPHLALFVGMKQALVLGLYPFIGGLCLKVYLAYFILKKMNIIDHQQAQG